jgi:hypothetical protein
MARLNVAIRALAMLAFRLKASGRWRGRRRSGCAGVHHPAIAVVRVGRAAVELVVMVRVGLAVVEPVAVVG